MQLMWNQSACKSLLFDHVTCHICDPEPLHPPLPPAIHVSELTSNSPTPFLSPRLGAVRSLRIRVYVTDLYPQVLVLTFFTYQQTG